MFFLSEEFYSLPWRFILNSFNDSCFVLFILKILIQFVSLVTDVDLIDFSSIFVASGHHSDDNVLSNLAVQQDLDFNSSDESEQMSAILRLPGEFT